MNKAALGVSVWLASGVVGCDDGTASKQNGERESKSAAEAESPAKPAASPTKAEHEEEDVDLCKSFDRDQIKEVFGWERLQKVSGIGGSAGDVVHRTCGYDAGSSNASFGVTFTTDRAFEPKHLGFGVTYSSRDPIAGHEARIGRNDRVVALQIMLEGFRLDVNASQDGLEPDELEPKLLEAAKIVIETMPANVEAKLRARR